MAGSSRRLGGQKALVTGAGSGIGRAVAEALGAAVVVNYRSDGDAAEAVVAAIEQGGGEAFAVQADVSREDEVEAMFAEAVRRFGTLDILVNNAGIQKDAPFAEMSLEDWRAILQVNLTGQFPCARAAVSEFLRRGRRGAASGAAAASRAAGAGFASSAVSGALSASTPRAASAAPVVTSVMVWPSAVSRQIGSPRRAVTSVTRRRAVRAPTTFCAVPPLRRSGSGRMRRSSHWMAAERMTS